MEEDRPNEYEEMMKRDEDFEEDVLETEADPLEKNIDEDIKKIGTIKSEEDIKEEDVEIEEKEDVQEESEEDMLISNNEEEPVEEKESKEDISIEEEPVVNEPSLEEEITESEPELEVEKEPVFVPAKKEVKKATKPKVIAKRSRTRKSLIKKKVAVKIAAKRQTTRKRKTSLFPIAYSIIGIAIIILAIFLLTQTTPTVTAAAIVNGEEISLNELEKEYEFFFLIGGLPPEYKQQITKEFFLNSTLIPEKLILTEAKNNNIQVTEEEVNTFVQNSIAQAGSTMEEFENTINNIGLTLDDIRGYFKKQLMSFKLLNATILSEIEVRDEEVEIIYNENKDIFEAQNQTLEEIKEELRSALLIQKQREAAQLYMAQLVQNADIQIYYPDLTPTTSIVVEDFTLLEEEEEEIVVVKDVVIKEVALPEVTADITTFSETNDELCEEDGKPVVRMYSTSWCPHCNWVKETFDNIAQEYTDLGKIITYHWQLDTGNDELTSTTELSVPRSEIELFQKYNPDGYVPVFIFGCKYYRVGNGYEAENNLAAEEAEFRAVIHSLI